MADERSAPLPFSEEWIEKGIVNTPERSGSKVHNA